MHVDVGCPKLVSPEIWCPLPMYSFETFFISGIFFQIMHFRISSATLLFLLFLLFFKKIITLYEIHDGILEEMF